MKRYSGVVASCVSLVVAVAGLGASAGWLERGPAAGELAFVLTEPRVQEFPAMRWVYLSTKTRLAGGRVGLDGQRLAERFTPEVLVALRPEGGMVREFIGNTGDPNAEFEIRVGFPVAAGTAVPAGFESAELPAFRAYGLVFSGPVEHLSKAYVMAYERLFQDGKFPSGTSREHVLYWEGAESPNNVSLILIGIEGP